MRFGERLRQLRKGLGLSQRVLAKKLGFRSAKTIQRFEAGKYLPTRKTQSELATIFEMNVNDMMDGERLTGGAEVLRVLRPYVELFLSSIAKEMRETGEKILTLQMQPLVDDYNKHQIETLMDKLRGEERYFAQIWRDLCDLESQNEKRLS